MGVHGLWDLLSPVGSRVPNAYVRNKILAVDISIWLTQFVRAMREAEGAMVPNAHLIGVFRRCCKLLFLSVKPVLVFDGATPALKRRTRDLRRAQRDRQVAKLRKLAEKLLLNQIRLRAVDSASKRKRKSTEATADGPGTKRLKYSDEPKAPSSSAAQGKSDEEDEIVPVHKSANNVDKQTGANTRPGYDPELDDIVEVGTDQGATKNLEDEDEQYIETEVHVELPNDLSKIDDDALVELPPTVQAEVFKQIRVAQRAQHREQVSLHMTVQNDPAAFSRAQIEGFLKYTALNKRIAKTRRKVNERSGASQRIASDAARQYVLEEREGDTSSNDDDLIDTSDSDQEFASKKIMSKKEKTDDLLTKIRLAREKKAARDAEKGEPQESVISKPLADTGLGWASRVLGGGGGHKLGGEEQVPVVKNESLSSDGENYSGSVSNSRRGDPNILAKVSALAQGRSLASQPSSDSDSSMEWEDGNETSTAKPQEIENVPPAAVIQSHEKNVPAEGKASLEENKIEIESIKRSIQREAGKKSSLLTLQKEALAGFSFSSDEDNEALTIVESKASASEFSKGNAGEISTEQGDDGEDTDLQKAILLSIQNKAESQSHDDSKRGSEEPELVGSLQGTFHGAGDASLVRRSLDIGAAGSKTSRIKNIEGNHDPFSDGNDHSFQSRNVSKAMHHCLNPEPSPLPSSPVRAIGQSSRLHDKPSENGIEHVSKPQSTLAAKIVQHMPLPKSNKPPENDTGKGAPCAEEGVITVSQEQLGKGRSLKDLQESAMEAFENAFGESTDDEAKDKLEADSKESLVKEGLDGTCIIEPKDKPHVVKGARANFELSNDKNLDAPMLIGDENTKNFEKEAIELAGGSSIFEKHNDGDVSRMNDVGSLEEKETVETVAENILKRATAIERTGDVADVPALDDAEMDRLRNNLEQERSALVQQQRQQQGAVESVSEEMYEETRDLLRLFGIPYLEAPMEAEAQCAFLNLKGLVDGVITEDSDVFLFGATNVYRHLFSDGKFAEEFELEKIQTELGINRAKLIRLAYLLGSDYTPGVRGIGIVNAMEVLEAFPGEKGLSEFFEWTKSVTILDEEPDEDLLQGNSQDAVRRRFCWKHRNMKRNWEFHSGFPNPLVEKEYWNPEVNRSEQRFKWKPVDFAALERFCWAKFGWDSSKFDDAVGPLRAELERRKRTGPEQRTIDEFFKPHRFAKIRSERLQRAVRGMAGTKSNKLMTSPKKKASRPNTSSDDQVLSVSRDRSESVSTLESGDHLTEDTVKAMSGKDLRAELRKLGLPTTGNVARMRSRLLVALKNSKESGCSEVQA